MNKIFAFSMLVLLTGFLSCEKSLTDLNSDPKTLAKVDGGILFSNATLALMDYMATPDKRLNNFRMFAQQWAETSYPSISSYISLYGVPDSTWSLLYATVIRDLKEVAILHADDSILSDENKRNQEAMAEVLEIFAWHLLVDLFGDIPYSAAFTDDATPTYDDDAAIYSDLILRLDNAIKNLDGDSRMGTYDLIYGGNVVKWRKFANSFKLRLAIRIADTNSDQAFQMVNEAITDGVFESSADDFSIKYLSAEPHTNPLWAYLTKSTYPPFVAANTIVDAMNSLNDPRLPYYFKGQYDGEWIGGTFGGTIHSSYSKPGELQHTATFPHNIISYTEVQFLLADAAERGYSPGGTAEDFYNAGIASSILEWGGTQEDVDAYLANPDVAYSTAPGATWKEKIAMQKWLALYNRGFEAWTTWRIYDAPQMNEAAETMRMPLVRYTYPVTEYSLNGENVQAAADAIGGDNLDSKVFWDVN